MHTTCALYSAVTSSLSLNEWICGFESMCIVKSATQIHLTSLATWMIWTVLVNLIKNQTDSMIWSQFNSSLKEKVIIKQWLNNEHKAIKWLQMTLNIAHKSYGLNYEIKQPWSVWKFLKTINFVFHRYSHMGLERHDRIFLTHNYQKKILFFWKFTF